MLSTIAKVPGAVNSCCYPSQKSKTWRERVIVMLCRSGMCRVSVGWKGLLLRHHRVPPLGSFFDSKRLNPIAGTHYETGS